MKILLIAVPVLIVIAVGGAYMYFQGQPSSNREQTQGTRSVYSKEQVAQHDTPEDCWTIINDGVYDVTSYVSRHPGGNEITRACGIDATELFETRTDSQGNPIGSGMPHSAAAEEQLEKLRIGNLQ